MRTRSVAIILFLILFAPAVYATSWKGTVRDKTGHAVGDATITLQAMNGGRRYSTNSSASGEFLFSDVEPQSYQVTVKVNDKAWNAPRTSGYS